MLNLVALEYNIRPQKVKSFGFIADSNEKHFLLVKYQNCASEASLTY